MVYIVNSGLFAVIVEKKPSTNILILETLIQKPNKRRRKHTKSISKIANMPASPAGFVLARKYPDWHKPPKFDCLADIYICECVAQTYK